MTAAVVGVIIGATAGGADIEAGVFRDLAATGRSRVELLLARVPGAWVAAAPLLLVASALPVAIATPDAGTLVGSVASVLAAGAVTSTVCVGLAALTGSRGMVIGIALAFQLGISPLLAQIGALGDARWAIPQVAVVAPVGRGGAHRGDGSRGRDRDPRSPGRSPHSPPAPGARTTQEI